MLLALFYLFSSSLALASDCTLTKFYIIQTLFTHPHYYVIHSTSYTPHHSPFCHAYDKLSCKFFSFYLHYTFIMLYICLVTQLHTFIHLIKTLIL